MSKTTKAKPALPAHLAETLRAVNRQWRSTLGIHLNYDGGWVGITATANRLAALEKLGLVEHERRGKAKWWRRSGRVAP